MGNLRSETIVITWDVTKGKQSVYAGMTHKHVGTVGQFIQRKTEKHKFLFILFILADIFVLGVHEM